MQVLLSLHQKNFYCHAITIILLSINIGTDTDNDIINRLVFTAYPVQPTGGKITPTCYYITGIQSTELDFLIRSRNTQITIS